MRILITGAAGGIARSLAARLEADRHVVTPAGRSPSLPEGRLRLDLADLPPFDVLVAALRGFDVLINCAGVWPGAPVAMHNAVHRDGPIAMFRAAIAAGVGRIVNLSALGRTDADVFLSSKHAADEWLLSNSANSLVLRPSAVYLPEGPSSRLFRLLARLPVRCVPASGPMRPIHVDDLCALVADLIATPGRSGLFELVGPDVLDLGEYVVALRRGLGRARGIQRRLPLGLMRRLDAPLHRFGGGLWARHGTALLAAGSTPSAAGTVLAGSTRPVEFARRQKPERRDRLVRPLARLSLSGVCLASAAMPLLWPDRVRPFEELARIGLEGPVASVAFVAMLVLDVVCGLLALFGRGVWVWRFLGIVFAAYAVVLGGLRPELWFDPFGALIKNLPMIALVAVLALTEMPAPTRRRP